MQCQSLISFINMTNKNDVQIKKNREIEMEQVPHYKETNMEQIEFLKENAISASIAILLAITFKFRYFHGREKYNAMDASRAT